MKSLSHLRLDAGDNASIGEENRRIAGRDPNVLSIISGIYRLFGGWRRLVRFIIRHGKGCLKFGIGLFV